MTVNKVLRRTGGQMLSGFILGRRSPGTGPVELLNLNDLTAMGVASSAKAAAAAATASTGFKFGAAGTMSANELIGLGSWADDVTFTNDDGTDTITAGVPATNLSSFQFKMLISGVETEIMTITFQIGGTTGVVDWFNSPQIVPGGTIVKLYAPAVADPTLADVVGTVYGAVG